MSFNGSGTFNLPAGNPVVTGTSISSTTHNTTNSELAAGLTNTICKDGQSTPTANIKMGGFKLTGLGAATIAGDAVRYEQVYCPAFSATCNQTLSVTGNYKIALNSEIFDTNSCFDAVTNYRFTPTIAGYYNIQGMIGGTVGNAVSGFGFYINKNGSLYVKSTSNDAAISIYSCSVNALIQMNGTTDYIEFYVDYASAGTYATIEAAKTVCSGYMVRGV